MSQSESTLSRFSINFMEHPSGYSTLHPLTELAHRAFAPPNKRSISTSEVLSFQPPATSHRCAVILHPTVGAGNPEISPVKAILHQTSPSRSARALVIDFRTRAAVLACEDQETEGIGFPIQAELIERVENQIKLLHMWSVQERNAVMEGQSSHVDQWADSSQGLQSSSFSLILKPYLHFHTPSIYKQCPQCETPSLHCISCRAVMCSNSACIVPQVIPIRCSQHVGSALCPKCWESDMFESPLIDQCPQCKLWFCDSELTWCLGRPDTDPSHRRAKPIGCFSCTGKSKPLQCINDDDCWSILSGYASGLRTGVCKSCSPEGGLWCRCRRSWVCDDCKEIDIFNRSCPRCRNSYCYLCDYIEFCGVCMRFTLCNDCFEEDWCRFGLGMDVDVPVLKGKCYDPDCGRSICADCLEGARCDNCRGTFCHDMGLESPTVANSRLCSACLPI